MHFYGILFVCFFSIFFFFVQYGERGTAAIIGRRTPARTLKRVLKLLSQNER